jgi:glycine/D-amino acid oxidase-like deaminating enzyme
MAESYQRSRRKILKAIGASASMAAIGACVPSPGGQNKFDRPLSRQPFVAPRVSKDRVIRTIVGLRPFRPSGFLVRRDQFDDKTVIHNYGHGGGGITLSWGSSALAVREAASLQKGPVAIVGGGIMGLSTARLLQDAGWQVTIYTRDMSRHSTSNIGAGQWSPTSVFDPGVPTAEFMARFKWASRISHHAFQNLAGADYGISWIENYFLSDQPFGEFYEHEGIHDLFPSTAALSPDEHPFPAPYVERYVTMLVQPATYLRRIRDDFYRAGGEIVIKDFKSQEEVLSLKETVIFNCTGLGAKELFDDDELMPIAGHLVFMPPDPAVDFTTFGGGKGVLYMMPRKGEILLGGTFDRGNWSTQPDPVEVDRIVEEHSKLFTALI